MATGSGTENGLPFDAQFNHSTFVDPVDLAHAIAASMDYPQASNQAVGNHGNWQPRTAAEWTSYENQQKVLQQVTEEKNYPDMQKGVAASLEAVSYKPQPVEPDQSTNPDHVDGGTHVVEPTEPDSPLRQQLDTYINDLRYRLASELPLTYDPDGDTQIYIDPPAKQPEQSYASYKQYARRYTSPLVVKSSIFQALESPVFQSLFGPSAQFRVLRRRKLVGKLPHRIKYVLELTPPTEGEEAVYQTTELCCSEGVRKWFRAGRRWKVAKTLIGGQEEYETVTQAPEAEVQFSLKSSEAPDEGPKSKDLIPLEYSPVRHRSAIERFIAAANGDDPHLDSAPKVWTAFAVAKCFEVTANPLTDYIVRWLRAFPNSYFLEVLPEVTLKIADGLQCYDLCRDVFAILVGEEALGTLRRARAPMPSARRAVYGRRKEDLPELFQTRIEYASKALVERVTKQYADLVSLDMDWLCQLPQYQKLCQYDQSHLKPRMVELKKLLKSYVGGTINQLACMGCGWMVGGDEGRKADDGLFDETPWSFIWNELLPRERILTRSFWKLLRAHGVPKGVLNTHRDTISMFRPLDTTNATKSALESASHKWIGFDNFHQTYAADIEESIAFCKRSLFQQKPKITIRLDQSMALEQPDGQVEPSALSTRFELPIRTAHEQSISLVDPTSMVTDAPVNPRGQWNDHFHHTFGEPADQYADADFFDFPLFLEQADAYLFQVCDNMLAAPDSPDRKEELDVRITNTLVCLEDSEWKYLPLWAGGNDDGSGGVFNDDVPLADRGFATAGPKVHTSASSANSNASSEFEFVRSQSNSTFNTSTAVNDGFSDSIPRGAVPSAHSNDSLWGDVLAQKDVESNYTGTMKGSSVAFESEEDYCMLSYEDREEAEARRALANYEKMEEEKSGTEKGKGKVQDEDYADLFGDDDVETEAGDQDPFSDDSDDDDDEDRMEGTSEDEYEML